MITSINDLKEIGQMEKEIERDELRKIAQISSKVFYQKNGIRVTLYSVQNNGKIVHQRVKAFENGLELDYCSLRRQGKKGVVCF
jgi:hypothetical protein